MKTILAAAATLLLSATTWAYQDGTYLCPNYENVPANTIKIKTVQLNDVSVPYVEATLNYRESSNASAPIKTSFVKGFATVHINSQGQESLVLAALHFEVENQKLRGCELK